MQADAVETWGFGLATREEKSVCWASGNYSQPAIRKADTKGRTGYALFEAPEPRRIASLPVA